MSLGRVAAATNRPGLLMASARGLRRWFPSLSGNVARAARRLPLMPVRRGDVDARLAAARRVFDEVDLFVAPSRSMAEEFRALGLPGSKIRVSDYGFPTSDPARGQRSGGVRGRDRLRIGFVGTLVWHKGVHVLIDALRGLPDGSHELVIYGNPDVFPDYAADLRAQAAGLPVRFAGAVARERIADAYADLDVLVVPSLWLENSPLVIHEAFMAGVPVVAARIGGVPDLIADGRNGLLYDPASVTELRTILAGLIANPQRLGELAAAAPAVKSIEQDAREWDAVYAEVA
jgi:glycosyltransferase involved in cell wall biosynthesis